MQNADIYSEFVKKTQTEYHSQLSNIWKENQFLFQWEQHEKILDVGCGPGDITATVIRSWLPQDFRSLVGVDISPTVISHALTHNASEKLNYEILDIGGDIADFLRNTIFPTEFNKIFSFYTLHWLYDLEKGVENLFKLLRPGGQMLLLFPVDRLFQKTFKDIRSKEPWSKHSKELSRKIPPFPTTIEADKEFKEMLLDAGFEVLRCEVQDMTSNFGSIENLKALIQSLDPDLDTIPTHLRNSYLQHCFERLLNKKVVEISDTAVYLTQSTLLAIAKKPHN